MSRQLDFNASRTSRIAVAAPIMAFVMASLFLFTGPARAGELIASLTAQYPVPPKVVWQHMADFASLADWHPMVTVVSVKGSGVGAVRTVTWSNGATLVEKLTRIDAIMEVDDDTGWMLTTIVESSLSITDYASRLQVTEGTTPGTSPVTWSSTFDAERISDKAAIEIYYQEGLKALAVIVEPPVRS